MAGSGGESKAEGIGSREDVCGRDKKYRGLNKRKRPLRRLLPLNSGYICTGLSWKNQEDAVF